MLETTQDSKTRVRQTGFFVILDLGHIVKKGHKLRFFRV